MLPAHFNERFFQMMAVKVDEITKSVAYDYSIASRNAVMKGNASPQSTQGL